MIYTASGSLRSELGESYYEPSLCVVFSAPWSINKPRTPIKVRTSGSESREVWGANIQEGKKTDPS